MRGGSDMVREGWKERGRQSLQQECSPGDALVRLLGVLEPSLALGSTALAESCVQSLSPCLETVWDECTHMEFQCV